MLFWTRFRRHVIRITLCKCTILESRDVVFSMTVIKSTDCVDTKRHSAVFLGLCKTNENLCKFYGIRNFNLCHNCVFRCYKCSQSRYLCTRISDEFQELNGNETPISFLWSCTHSFTWSPLIVTFLGQKESVFCGTVLLPYAIANSFHTASLLSFNLKSFKCEMYMN